MRSSVLIAGVVVALAGRAWGGGVVLESYTQGRPTDADQYTNPLFEVLAKAGFSDPDQVRRQFETDISRPAIVKQGLPLDFEKQLDAGIAIYGGNFHNVVEKLGPLVELAHQNSGAFANRESLRTKLKQAHIMLALAHQFDGDPSGAEPVFLEWNRAFPGEKVSAATFGAPANKAYADVVAKSPGYGNLIVNTTAPGVGVYIDEKLDGLSPVTRSHAAAGQYRVFVQTGTGLSRTHLVTVAPNKDATVTIDAEFDQAVNTEGWVGLKFADAAARAKNEAAYAAKFGNAMNADQIVVIGIDTVGGRQAVIASLISKSSGERIRGAQVALANASPDQMRNLARYITGAGATGEVKPLSTEDVAAMTAKANEGGGGEVKEKVVYVEKSGRWSGWKWAALTGAVIGFGVGAPLYHYDDTCADSGCRYKHQFTAGAFSCLGGGAILAGAAIYLFASGDGGSKQATSTAYVAPTAGGAMAGYAFEF